MGAESTIARVLHTYQGPTLVFNGTAHLVNLNGGNLTDADALTYVVKSAALVTYLA